MVCVLLAAPVSVSVIFPLKAGTCGLNVEASAVTVSVTGPPGNTMPLAGATVIHVAVPGDAENEIGPPVVVKTTVCAAGAGGFVKVREFALIVKVGGGSVTISFTLVVAPVPGGTATAGVNTTAAVYVPTASPVGFTCRLTLDGRLPESGLAVSHSALTVDPVGLIAVV